MFIFERWQPIDNLPKEMYVEALLDDFEGIRLILASSALKKILRLSFHSPLSYRNTDEGDLLKTIFDLNDSGKNDGSFFTIKKSSYLEWFCGGNDFKDGEHAIVHYAIFTPNDCVEILSIEPPTAEWLKT